MSPWNERYWSAFNTMGKVVGAAFSLWGSVFAVWGVYRLFHRAHHDPRETILIEGGGVVVIVLGILILKAKPFRKN